MSKFLNISLLEIKEAIAVGVVTFIGIVITEIIAANTIFGLEWKIILNSAIIGAISSIGTFLKSLLTTSKGTLAGVKIK